MAESTTLMNTDRKLRDDMIPQTVFRFKQMIDENIGLDIEPNEFIQISTYIALQMAQTMKETDDKSHEEYMEKRDMLMVKRKKWDEKAAKELKKIDGKKEKYQHLLNTLESKREILTSKLQIIHKKHVEFLQMEKKKNEVLQKLEQNRKELEHLLVDKIEDDLFRFENELKKVNEIYNKTKYDKLVKRIKICRLKKQVIESKLESIARTTELTELKSLDLNECHCVFCKGYSPHQYVFGIRKDVSASKFRQKLSQQTPGANVSNIDLSESIMDLSDDDPHEMSRDENDTFANILPTVIEEHSSEEKHDELLGKAMKKPLNVYEDMNACDVYIKAHKRSKKKQAKKSRRSSTMGMLDKISYGEKKQVKKRKKKKKRHKSLESNALRTKKDEEYNQYMRKKKMVDLDRMMHHNDVYERPKKKKYKLRKRYSEFILDDEELYFGNNRDDEKAIKAKRISKRSKRSVFKAQSPQPQSPNRSSKFTFKRSPKRKGRKYRASAAMFNLQ